MKNCNLQIVNDEIIYPIILEEYPLCKFNEVKIKTPDGKPAFITDGFSWLPFKLKGDKAEEIGNKIINSRKPGKHINIKITDRLEKLYIVLNDCYVLADSPENEIHIYFKNSNTI